MFSLRTPAFTNISRSNTCTKEQVSKKAPSGTRQQAGGPASPEVTTQEHCAWSWAQKIPFSRLGLGDRMSLKSQEMGEKGCLSSSCEVGRTHMSGGHKSLPGRRQCLADRHADCTPSSETPLSLLVIKGVRKVKKYINPINHLNI